MGRPPVKDPRNLTLTTRINRAENKTIREAAKKAGMRIGEYIRLRLLGGDDGTPVSR